MVILAIGVGSGLMNDKQAELEYTSEHRHLFNKEH